MRAYGKQAKGLEDPRDILGVGAVKAQDVRISRTIYLRRIIYYMIYFTIRMRPFS